LIYPNVDLVQFRGESAPRAFAAVVIGLSTVEVLKVGDDAWESEALCPPTSAGCSSEQCAPVALALADVDLDSKDDLLVFDTDCGNWIAPDISGPSRTTLPWDQLMPELGPDYTLFVQDIDSNGVDEVVAANPDRVSVAAHNDGWHVSYGYPTGWPRMDHMRTTRLALAISRASSGERLLALQRGSLMQVYPFEWDQDEILGQPELWQQENLEYEKPYSGFDHFTEISLENCDVFAVGIGLFEITAGPVPRELQVLRQTAGGFSSETLTTVAEVEHFTVLRSLSEERYFVILFERQASGQEILQLAELTECDHWKTLESFEIEFDWRTIDNPEYFRELRYPQTLGVKLAAWLSQDERSIDLTHYDGFSVRSFHLNLDLESKAWTLQSTTQTVYETRADLVLR
jgi:hypothetical protein